MISLKRIRCVSFHKVLQQHAVPVSIECGMNSLLIPELFQYYLEVFCIHLLKENNKFGRGILLKR